MTKIKITFTADKYDRWSGTTEPTVMSFELSVSDAKHLMHQITHQLRDIESEQQIDLSKFNSMNEDELVEIAMRIRQTPQFGKGEKF